MELKYTNELISKNVVITGVAAHMANHAEMSLRVTYEMGFLSVQFITNLQTKFTTAVLP